MLFFLKSDFRENGSFSLTSVSSGPCAQITNVFSLFQTPIYYFRALKGYAIVLIPYIWKTRSTVIQSAEPQETLVGEKLQ